MLRSGAAGSAIPGRLISRNASWNGRHAGCSISGSRLRSALATARFAIRNASSASGSPASVAIPRSIRPAANAGRREQCLRRSTAAPRRAPAISASRASIQARYSLTSGASAACAAAPSDEGAERLHPQLGPADVRRDRLLDLGRRDPPCPQQPALAIDEIPVDRYAVAGRELRGVGVVQVRDLLVPLRVARSAGPAAGRTAARSPPRAPPGKRTRGRAASGPGRDR